jgi:hypothetical protein
MPFLIQGLFFQDRQWLGVGNRPGDGVVAIFHSGLCRHMFAGAVWQDPERVQGVLTGTMHDAFGDSILTDIRIDESEVSYSKMYLRRGGGNFIHYTFRKRKGLEWVGEFNGVDCGNGISTCLVTEVGDDFFQVESILSILNRDRAYVLPEEG